jgi:hypothetical protein
VVGADVGLLDPAIAHCRAMGVESFHIVRHVESLGDPGFAPSRAVMACHGLEFAAVHQGPWDEDLNGFLIRAQMRRYPRDWWVVADLDEFHVYERPLTEIIDACERRGCDYVRGALLDRVAADGSLAPLSPAVPVWEQYPLAGLLTLRVLRAVTSKVTLARGEVRLHEGQHWALNGRPLPATEAFAQVHHFKWTDTVRQRLERRVRAFSSGEWYVPHPAVTEESRRMIRYLDRNGGRVDVASPDLGLIRCDDAYTDYTLWPRVVRMPSLHAGHGPIAPPTDEEIASLFT